MRSDSRRRFGPLRNAAPTLLLFSKLPEACADVALTVSDALLYSPARSLACIRRVRPFLLGITSVRLGGRNPLPQGRNQEKATLRRDYRGGDVVGHVWTRRPIFLLVAV